MAAKLHHVKAAVEVEAAGGVVVAARIGTKIAKSLQRLDALAAWLDSKTSRAHLFGSDLCQISNGPIRLMPLQFLEPDPSRGHGQDFGPDCAPAADVERGVANDKDLVATQILPKNPNAALAGNGGNLIAVFAVVAKPARRKKGPQLEMAQLDLQSEPDVACQ